MLVSVAFSSSIEELLAVVRRDEVDREPHALGLAAVHADAEEVEEQLGGHRPDHVGAARIRGLALRDAGPQLVGGGEEAVAQPGVLLLVAELLEDVGQQVLGGLVVRLGLHQLVQDLLRRAGTCPRRAVARPRARIFSDAAHHLDIERRGVGRRQRDQRRRVAVPEAEDSAG